MSTQLFATVSVEQQEIIAGGRSGRDDYRFQDLAKYKSEKKRRSYGYANEDGAGFGNWNEEEIFSLVRSELDY